MNIRALVRTDHIKRALIAHKSNIRTLMRIYHMEIKKKIGI